MDQVKYPASFHKAKELLDVIVYRLQQLKYQIEASEQNFTHLTEATQTSVRDPFGIVFLNKQRNTCYDNLARTRAALDLINTHIQTIKHKTEIIEETSLIYSSNNDK